ncbi:UNKNOWN [Stylonychia lemnae]|uniref:Uncharacterized protein n=1 Tax=Stylonychia lemnae TaxID=5949 RepID=A0A077ZW87_STYLE|nr:UNKNOWN [Stylonychia lemnae]|eukprot:CDW73530.1 UNKNOWN [Stylonychia lemnae]
MKLMSKYLYKLTLLLITLTSRLTSATSGLRTSEQLRSDLRSVLEQAILLQVYPGSLFTFQIFVLKDETQGVQLFSSCLNGLLSVLHQSGIAMKLAPLISTTILIRQIDMSDDQSQLEIITDPTKISESDDKSSLLDIVASSKSDIAYIKSMLVEFDYGMLFTSEANRKHIQKILKSKLNQLTSSFLQ